MVHSTEEKERIRAIKRHQEKEDPIVIYKSIGRSKRWFFKWLKRYKTGEKEWYQDRPKTPLNVPHKTSSAKEEAVVNIRKTLMEGTEEFARFSRIGPEAIQYHMEELGYELEKIPSLSTIKRIVKRNKLRKNKKKRYKRVKSKGRHTILKIKYVDEMHQIDYVGPRHITGFGSINSLHMKDVIGRQAWGNQYREKSMNNVLAFLLEHWKRYPIPKYIQVDNGMCFVGDFKHPKSFSRFVRLCLYVGIEVVFIAPAKPWMNGTVEEFNKGFDERFWTRELFKDLNDIQKNAQIFYHTENKYNTWKMKNKDVKSLVPSHLLQEDFKINVNNLPLVTGKVHFIRIVDSKGKINILNEYFEVGEEYIGEYVWATIETRNQLLTALYNDKNLNVREIKEFTYKIPEKVCFRKHNILLSR